MSHVVIARGVKQDILFRLFDRDGGNLIDDADWLDGSTDDEWPEVKFLDGVSDVTGSFVVDLVGETVQPGWMKHPTTATGTIREAQGKYRSRVEPSGGLTLKGYTMEVTYNPISGGASKVVTHTITLVAEGDVEFGTEFNYCSEQDVLDNFELEDAVSTTQVDKAILKAESMIHANLRPYLLDVPQPASDDLKLCAVAFARADLRRLIAGVSGQGTGIQSIKEGDTEMRFVSPDKQFKALYDEGMTWLDIALIRILGGTAVLKTSTWGNVDRM